jgi:hypothetical protein
LCAIVLAGAFFFIPNDHRCARLVDFDLLGALLAAGHSQVRPWQA